MTNILGRFASTLHTRFTPASPDDYFALRLAIRLGEPGAASHYAVLVSQYSQDRLLTAYRRAIAARGGGASPAQAFHERLTAAGEHVGGWDSAPHPRLLAIRVERRTIAVALFGGTRFIGRRVLHLSSNSRRAESSIAGFVRKILRENDCESVAIESVSKGIQRSLLHAAVLTQCRATEVSVWEISKTAVLSALTYPPLRTRKEARDLMRQIWPLPDLRLGEVCVLDAFALGLYVQTERQFAAEF